MIEFTDDDQAGIPVHALSHIANNGATTTYDYTATGNRMTKIEGLETTGYTTNDDNMISQITVNGTTTNFYYDAGNKRIKKTQGIASTLYFGQDFEIINSTPTLYVFAGNIRVAQVTDTALNYYHKDHLGSTEAISRQDGTVIDFGEYMPYGLDRNSNALLQTSSYKFTDQEQDDGTGLYNYDARLYDPVLGQFIMADTIVPDPFNPQSLNRYAYCLNNPVIYVDPSGHDQDDSGDGGTGGSGGNVGHGGGSGSPGSQGFGDGIAGNDPDLGFGGNTDFGGDAPDPDGRQVGADTQTQPMDSLHDAIERGDNTFAFTDVVITFFGFEITQTTIVTFSQDNMSKTTIFGSDAVIANVLLGLSITSVGIVTSTGAIVGTALVFAAEKSNSILGASLRGHTLTVGGMVITNCFAITALGVSIIGDSFNRD